MHMESSDQTIRQRCIFLVEFKLDTAEMSPKYSMCVTLRRCEIVYWLMFPTKAERSCKALDVRNTWQMRWLKQQI